MVLQTPATQGICTPHGHSQTLMAPSALPQPWVWQPLAPGLGSRMCQPRPLPAQEGLSLVLSTHSMGPYGHALASQARRCQDWG